VFASFLLFTKGMPDDAHAKSMLVTESQVAWWEKGEACRIGERNQGIDAGSSGSIFTGKAAGGWRRWPIWKSSRPWSATSTMRRWIRICGRRCSSGLVDSCDAARHISLPRIRSARPQMDISPGAITPMKRSCRLCARAIDPFRDTEDAHEDGGVPLLL
jgi:hypothetical protein